MKKAFFVLKRFAYVLLCAILLAGQFSPLYVSADTGTGEQETESRVSTTRLEELARAVKLGFGNNIDSTEEITYAEYIEMLDKLVVLIYPDDAAKLQQWQGMYPEARICYDKLERSNAMYLLYAVAHDILGEKYCRDPQRVGRYTNWGELNAYMGEVWDEYSTNIELFDDTAVQEQIAGANFTSSRHANAYYFSYIQSSVNGYPLFDYDAETNSMRVNDILTWQEAMLSVIRLYESIEHVPMESEFVNVENVATYNTNIITSDLLARAQYMPEPTTESLPYYTGVAMTYKMWDSDFTTEAQFCLWADMGFNYVRIQLSCMDFFNDDITQVDEAELQELDRIISWALKYGIHLSIQFTDYPGHIQVYELDEENGQVIADTDFYTNTVKQEQTARLWQTIAKRYKGIPNNAISFITNHEPDNPGRSTGTPFDPYTAEDIERVSKYIINAVKEVDSERLQFYAPRYNQCGDNYMEGAGAAFVGFNNPQRFIYWNMINDFSYKGGYLPEWPFYEVPNWLEDDKKSLVIDGFLPTGTKISVSSNDAWTHSQTFPTLTLEATNDGVSSVLHQVQMADEGGTLEYTLTEAVDSLELSVDFSGVILEKFVITLPEEYAKNKYYYSGVDFVYGNVGGEVEVRNTSEIDIKLGTQYSQYLSMSDTIREESVEMAYIIDDTATVDVTITEDCSYTSNYGYTLETLQKLLDQYNAQLEDIGCVGMNYEFGPGTAFVEDTVLAFYDDLLSVFEKEQHGWGLFFPMSLTSANYHIGATREPMDNTGILVDQKLLSVLQKYMADRPVIMVDVPKPVVCEHNYEDVVTQPTVTEDGSIVSTCTKCGKVQSYEVLEALGCSFEATLYSDAEYQTSVENLGEFGDIGSLNTAIAQKEGYLKIRILKDTSLTAFPYAEGISGIKITPEYGEEYTLTLSEETYEVKTDVVLETGLEIRQEGSHIKGNDSEIILMSTTVNGGTLSTEDLGLVLAGTVTVNAKIDGADALYINQNISTTNNNGSVEWENQYPYANVFINAAVTGIKEFFIYGDKVFISGSGSLSTEKISGVYGDIYLQKTGEDLADITVSKSMADMIWQIRLHPYETIANDCWETEYAPIESGTAIANIAEGADDSCVEKLGVLYKDENNNDVWDDYYTKELRNNVLYFGEAPECKHANTEVRNAKEETCGEEGYTGDEYCEDCGEPVNMGSPIPATGEHTYKDGACDVCNTPQLEQADFGFAQSSMIKVYGDAAFSVSATGAVSGSSVSYTSSNPAVATVDNTGKVTILKAGSTTITATASEAEDYAEAKDTLSLTVNKSSNTPNMPSDIMSVESDVATAGAISLPADWKWENANTALTEGGTTKVTAVYNGADKGNYVTEKVVVSITRAKAVVYYTIQFHANGGSGSMSALSNRVYGTSYRLTANAYSRTGYVFAGWNTKADGSGTAYKDGASVKNLSSTNGSKVTLYAQWAPIKPHKITNVVSGVHVYWTAVSGAQKYGLWRSENGVNGTYKWIANPTVAHFTDTKVESGKTYYYKVTVLNTSTNRHSPMSEAIGVTFVSTPDITLRVNRGAGIGLTWQKVTGATGYAIYRKPYSGSGDWVRITTITNPNTLSWNDTSVRNQNGSIYKYTIRALAGSNRTILSGCRPAGRTMVRLSSRTMSSAAKAGTTSIKCSWNTTSQATGYEVRFMVGSEVYKTYTIGNYKTGTRTFTGLKAGQTYKIQVRTYKRVEGVGSFYSAWSAEKYVEL